MRNSKKYIRVFPLGARVLKKISELLKKILSSEIPKILRGIPNQHQIYTKQNKRRKTSGNLFLTSTSKNLRIPNLDHEFQSSTKKTPCQDQKLNKKYLLAFLIESTN